MFKGYDKFILGVSALDVFDFLGWLNSLISAEILMILGYAISIIFFIDIIYTIVTRRSLDIYLIKDIVFLILTITPFSFLRATRFLKFTKFTKYLKHLPLGMRIVNGVCLSKNIHKMIKE